MIHKIRTSKLSKVIASYLAIQLIITTIQPIGLFALTSGPSQPEFNSFTPIGTSDMVNLSSGDFNYNLPIMDVGGYPLNLAYQSGITMDQEASWVGLGWNLNVGQIARNVRGLPDDFQGDEMIYENNLKDNVTVGANFNLFGAIFGVNEGDALSPSVGFGIKYNNYNGLGFSLTGGLNYQIAENLSVGVNMSASDSEGTSVSPSVSFHQKGVFLNNTENTLSASVGTSLDSRKGLTNLTMSASRKRIDQHAQTLWNGIEVEEKSVSVSSGGSISFVDASFTPAKRVGMKSSSYTFSMNLEGAFHGFEPGVKFTGYRTKQGIDDSEKYKTEKAYGYEHTIKASKNDVLDFNREKDRTFNQYSTTLPITNYTYDIYSIQGQGVAGMFRPYKGQVGHIFDKFTKDQSFSGSLGLEFGGGSSTHWGFDAEVNPLESRSKRWETRNHALPKFKEIYDSNNPAYENTYFKTIGGFHVDNEYENLFQTKLGGYDPMKLSISGSRFARNLDANLLVKSHQSGQETAIPVTSYLKRTERVNRNQSIQKLTRKEATLYGFNTQFSPYSKAGLHDHHTSEINILKTDGSRYIYGLTAYNVTKKETTFDVSGRSNDCQTGLVSYSPNSDNSANNNRSGDQYFNRITTPAYAHTYLLTSVLSSDYEDLTGDGPTPDDLGAYTHFTYENKNNDVYKWRIPYDKNKANYNEGISSSEKDDKGNYVYGEKEIVYVKKIETKTHVARFHLSERDDAVGVDNENGGGSAVTPSKMWKLDKIALYAKPEYDANGDNAEPIKVAHFEYDYSLCKGVKNNFNSDPNNNGKLTLKKVYFTYRSSNMGAYTPYTFGYNSFNPDYNIKAYDIWGNYMPMQADAGCNLINENQPLTNSQYPYVDQSQSNDQQNDFAGAWSLNTINLPSGGKIELELESDDYRYVQNKKALQMFKVVGVGAVALSSNTSPLNQSNNDLLYKNGKTNHLYIKLDDVLPGTTEEERRNYFRENYLGDLVDSPIYFRFLLNMTKPGGSSNGINDSDFDFVTGYLHLDKQLIDAKDIGFYSSNGEQYASVPIKEISAGKGVQGTINPIAKAGWNYGRTYLNRKVYSISNEEDVDDIEGIVIEILGAIPAVLDIFRSPNGQLKDRNIARRFIRNKSWIRLMHPKQRKMGGGLRVKTIKMYDNWDAMTGNDGNENYLQHYGQEYSYDSEDGFSSGVATYEPLGSKENPFVEPYYDKTNPGLLLGVDEQNYVEKPLGESFFPSPTVTYSRVKVNNLSRERILNEGTKEEQRLAVKKHASGHIINEFYTSLDYPTIVDNTILTTRYDKSSALAGLLNLRVRNHLTLSQGYMVHTNDMNGKMKSRRIYAEGQTQYISGVDYIYDNNDIGNTNYNPNQGKLNNVVTTIDDQGNVSEKLIGVDYDVINDFRDNKTISQTYGVKFNTEGLPVPLIPPIIIVPTPLPKVSIHDTQIKMATTTKVIHTSGIMREKIAYDVGAQVSSKNLAWDANTGQVLLTKTINEYDDNYYNFSYPSYWAYSGMNQSAKNLDLSWDYSVSGENFSLDSNASLIESEYLHPGDELWIQGGNSAIKAWVTDVTNSSFKLIDDKGIRISAEDLGGGNGTFKIIRSGHRNLPLASMASVISMKNPIGNGTTAIDGNTFDTDDWDKNRIVNASAAEYNNQWPAQCECQLPPMQFDEVTGELVFDYNNEATSYNPYIYNILGDWRTNRAFAYLTGRNFADNPTPRNTGFFANFKPLYQFNGTHWYLDDTRIATPGISAQQKWTFASQVSQYSPYGLELENKDALNRYSSAVYGYNHHLPIAVGSNSQYKELGYDGFEDYDFDQCDDKKHFSFSKNTVLDPISVTDEHAHSGRNSLRIEPGSYAKMSQQIISCDDIEENNNQKSKTEQSLTLAKKN